jgi:hypothetical protein
MIDGGSYRDCGCDRPQLVDNVGEIGGEPHSRVGTRRWVGSGGLIPFATRLDAAQQECRSPADQRGGFARTQPHRSCQADHQDDHWLARQAPSRAALRAQQGGDANHLDLRLPTIGDAGDAHPPEAVPDRWRARDGGSPSRSYKGVSVI